MSSTLVTQGQDGQDVYVCVRLILGVLPVIFNLSSPEVNSFFCGVASIRGCTGCCLIGQGCVDEPMFML